jgi:hypothetical protein
VSAESTFKRLKAEAIRDPAREPAMLSALLSTPVYVHLPVSDDSGKTRLVCWDRPDGLRVIPFFSDAAAAMAANGASTRVGCVRGGELFASAPGATFMLDPNGESMTLYPEEIAALLAGEAGLVAPIAAEGPDLELSPPTAADRWLMDRLARALDDVPEVRRVHLAEARPRGARTSADRLLVIVAVPSVHAERAARAASIAVQVAFEEPRLAIDLTTYDPDAGLGARQVQGLERAWTRELR